MKRISALLLTLSISAAAFSAEQILNGGAESWTGAVPDSWTTENISSAGVVNPTAGAFTISQNTTNPHSGTSAIQIVNTASQFTYRYGLHTNSFQVASWSPAKDVSAWLHTTGNAANTRIARGYFVGGVWNVQTTAQIALTALNTWLNLTTNTWDLHTNPTRVSVHIINAGTTLADDFSVDATVPVSMSAFTIE